MSLLASYLCTTTIAVGKKNSALLQLNGVHFLALLLVVHIRGILNIHFAWISCTAMPNILSNFGFVLIQKLADKFNLHYSVTPVK